MRVWRSVVLRCSLEGRMQMHMVLACPILPPQSHGNPSSARSAHCSVEKLSLSMQQESLAMVKRSFPVLGKL